MIPLATLVTTAEIFAIFVLGLCTSFGIAFIVLKTVVSLTTYTHRKEARSAGLVSRRSLAAFWLRAHTHAER